MAYRKLHDGDLVRVVDIKNRYHGYDAIVIDAQQNYARVQIAVGLMSAALLESSCIDVLNRNLLVRHSTYAFIKDGRVDHEAKRIHDEIMMETSKEDKAVDNAYDGYYDDWSFEDLIYRIRELEYQVNDL